MSAPASERGDARREALLVIGVALAARAAVALWAGDRFAPAADGTYYHAIAARIAAGLGSTWAWPDGAVTYVAHYPVGYPAVLALALRALGDRPLAVSCVGALVGALAPLAAWALARRAAPRGRAGLVAGLAVALHPGLVAYTPAAMTEGVTTALVAASGWAFATARGSTRPWRRVALGAVVLGLATLVRPQSLALAPLFGWLSLPSPSRPRARLAAAGVALAVTVAVCLPWTARNCVRMGRCGLVSFNGGWNLLIGAAEGSTGAWSPVEVPPECATVWDEAAKDACFGAAARRRIAAAPARWLSLAPAKLAATFDYAGAAGYYLHASRPDVFDDDAKAALGAVETVYERVAYVLALVAAARLRGPRHLARGLLAVVALVALFTFHGWVGVVGLSLVLGLLGGEIVEAPMLVGATAATIAATAATHAAFFGAGRYGMIVFPFVTALAACAVFDTARRTRRY